MSKKSLFESLQVKNPCSEEWDKMAGNNKVRLCSHCSTEVNDLSRLTVKQAMRLVGSSNGSICVRFKNDPLTGRPMFAEQLHRITRRSPGIAAGVMTASIALATQAYAQSPVPVPATPPAAVEKIEKNETPDPETQTITSRQIAELPIQGSEFVTMGLVVSTRVIEYKSPLIAAVNAGDLDRVRMLLGSGASIRAKEQDGTTALSVAVNRGNLEIVRYLLDAGAKVNVADKSKQTPLMQLDDDSSVELANLLILHGAKVNVKDEDGNTPLILAARNASAAVLKVLIDAGAEVNAVNSDGETALMAAADNDNIEKVRLLLLAGAEVNAHDKEGDTAWDRTSQKDIEELLVVYGAVVKVEDDMDAPPPPE